MRLCEMEKKTERMKRFYVTLLRRVFEKIFVRLVAKKNCAFVFVYTRVRSRKRQKTMTTTTTNGRNRAKITAYTSMTAATTVRNIRRPATYKLSTPNSEMK